MGNQEIEEARAVSIAEQPREFSAPTLFKTDDPSEIVARATRIADALNAVIQQKKLFKNMGTAKEPKNHVLVEAWTLCGAMLGVFPHIVWTREIGSGDWEARAEARTATGNVIASAEAMCTQDEPKWGKRPKYEWIGIYPNKVKTLVGEEMVASYARRSMAQTRAIAKAMRMPLGFIVSMAGYSTTPAEEMPDNNDTDKNSSVEEPRDTQPKAAVKPIGPQAIANSIYDAAKAQEAVTTIPAAVIIAIALDAFGFKTRKEVTPEKQPEVIARIRDTDAIVDAELIAEVSARLSVAPASDSDDTGPGDDVDQSKSVDTATEKEIVSAIFEIRARVEKALGKQSAAECMAVAKNEANIPDRAIKLYLKKGTTLLPSERLATKAELIQFHASLAEIADEKMAKVTA